MGEARNVPLRPLLRAATDSTRPTAYGSRAAPMGRGWGGEGSRWKGVVAADAGMRAGLHQGREVRCELTRPATRGCNFSVGI